jgi:hypothetical protein
LMAFKGRRGFGAGGPGRAWVPRDGSLEGTARGGGPRAVLGRG